MANVLSRFSSDISQLTRESLANLDAASGFRRALIGLGAILSMLTAGFFGIGFALAPAQGPALRWIKAIGLGGGLCLVAAFMLLVCLRSWLGRRGWIDAALVSLAPRVFVYLLVGICVLLLFVVIQMCWG